MTKLMNYALCLLLAVSVMACGKKAEDTNNKDNTAQNGNDTKKTDAEKEAEKVKKEAEAVIDAYIALKDALVKTDQDAAMKRAIDLKAVLALRENVSEEMRTAAKAISGAEDVKTQREAFFTLSNEMIAYAKETKAKSGGLFVQFCPMARNDEGAPWLSLEKEVNNPYFGDEMLHCGTVQETL